MIFLLCVVFLPDKIIGVVHNVSPRHHSPTPPPSELFDTIYLLLSKKKNSSEYEEIRNKEPSRDRSSGFSSKNAKKPLQICILHCPEVKKPRVYSYLLFDGRVQFADGHHIVFSFPSTASYTYLSQDIYCT